MPPDIEVATDPLLVYGLVALFAGAIVLALIFARPRRGLGAINRSDVPDRSAGDAPWMPGGDIFGRAPQPEPAPPAAAPEVWPSADPWQSAPAQHHPQPAVHDPWSTGATDEPGAQPRWDKR